MTTGDSDPPERYADVAETHTAVVFFAGDRAYKLKKPVRTGFLDFSTREARAAACQRETELNARFAPDVYLGVAEVRDQAGRVCDHLVVMRRMPGSRRLSALIGAGDPAGDAVRQVARILAAQHAAAPRGPRISAQGSPAALARRWSDNVEQIRPLAGGVLDGSDVDEVERLAGRFVAGRERLLEARISDGRVVDGHGDLLSGDIFCLDDGPRILDCLEFDDALRWLDGLDDAACLAMDLERLGASELAGRFIAWYTEYSGDPAPPSLRHHYVAYRAFMRAKVACIRLQQGDAQAAGESRQLTSIALAHLRAGAVSLILVGGQPGTGKSLLAGQLAGDLGWTVLSSDRVRKELAGLAPDEHSPAPYGAGIYAADWTERTYAELLHRAAELLSVGESVIIDATWGSAGRRAAAAAVAERTSADLVQLRCTAPPEVAAARIRSRTGSASDADPQIAAMLAAAEDPWPDAVSLDSGGDTALAALAVIRPAPQSS
ncbi:MAG TPA: AAA family ATPase [Streptosporangiaceae bacterium]